MADILKSIWDAIYNFGYLLANFLIGWIHLPQVPTEIKTSIDSFLDLIFQGANLIGFFIPLGLVKILLPLILLVINFEFIYKSIMFFVKKIPMLGIK